MKSPLPKVGQKVICLIEQYEGYASKNKEGFNNPITMRVGEYGEVRSCDDNGLVNVITKLGKNAILTAHEYELQESDLKANQIEAAKEVLGVDGRALAFGAFRAQGFHVEEIIRLAQAGLA